MGASKQVRNEVLDLTRNFLTAVRDRKDWHPFGQLRARQSKAAPNMPTFSEFKVLRSDPMRGRDPEVWRSVLVEILLAGNDQVRRQTVNGKFMAVKECDREQCAACEGTGVTETDRACSVCGGEGVTKVDPPRVPTKGTDTYDLDMENGRWGICPASFEFIPGTQEPVE